MTSPNPIDNIDNNDLKSNHLPTLCNIQDSQHLDLSLVPHVNDLVEASYVKGSNLYIHLKKPRTGIVIATIMNQFISFRKEIEKQLKDNDVNKQDIKKIISLITLNHKVIYIDHNSGSTSNSNKIDSVRVTCIQSDQSDQEAKVVNVSECMKLNEGKVKVMGDIFSVSEPYKVISHVIEKCDCGEKNRPFDPPLHSLSEAEGKCYSCDKRFEYNSKTVRYRNAIGVQIQDDGKFNDLERLACILLDLDTDKIKVGEKVIITGTVHIRSS